MVYSGPTLTHPSSGGTALHEREVIRALLLEQRPELGRQLVVGPSGALVIPLPAGRSIEIGRMRRRGSTHWVVVAPSADGAVLLEPANLGAVARAALGALEEVEAQR
ncbi:MAG: hypothetical protein GX960_02320 [Actinomycetales bacterium]|nr:hypothetical protein [Actinomycetales bacterium]